MIEKLTSSEAASAPADGGHEEQDGGRAGEGRERQLRRAGPLPHKLQGPRPQIPASGQLKYCNQIVVLGYVNL